MSCRNVRCCQRWQLGLRMAHVPSSLRREQARGLTSSLWGTHRLGCWAHLPPGRLLWEQVIPCLHCTHKSPFPACDRLPLSGHLVGPNPREDSGRVLHKHHAGSSGSLGVPGPHPEGSHPRQDWRRHGSVGPPWSLVLTHGSRDLPRGLSGVVCPNSGQMYSVHLL